MSACAIARPGFNFLRAAEDERLGNGATRAVAATLLFRANALGAQFYLEDAYEEIARWIPRVMRGLRYGRTAISEALTRLVDIGFMWKAPARGRGLEITLLWRPENELEQSAFRTAQPPVHTNARAVRKEEEQKNISSSSSVVVGTTTETEPEPAEKPAEKPAEQPPPKPRPLPRPAQPIPPPAPIPQSAEDLEPSEPAPQEQTAPPAGIDREGWHTILRDSRERRSDASNAEIREVFDIEHDAMPRYVARPAAWLIKIVPRAVESRLDRIRQVRRARAEAPPIVSAAGGICFQEWSRSHPGVTFDEWLEGVDKP